MSAKAKSWYSQALRDPRWQRKRLEIFQRDDWRCRKCGTDSKNLQIHHTKYERGKNPWEYPGFVLLTLCEDCHSDETFFQKNPSVHQEPTIPPWEVLHGRIKQQALIKWERERDELLKQRSFDHRRLEALDDDINRMWDDLQHA